MIQHLHFGQLIDIDKWIHFLVRDLLDKTYLLQNIITLDGYQSHCIALLLFLKYK